MRKTKPSRKNWIGIAGVVFILLIVASTGYLSKAAREEQLDHALIEAVKTEHTQDAARPLTLGANPNARAPALIRPANWLDALRMRLHLPSPGAASKTRTALMIAAANGNAEICKLLLNRGANVNARTEYGSTALIQAAGSVRSNKSIVRLLVEHGADVNAQTRSGTTALLETPTWNSIARAQILLDHGADVNAADASGATALIYASSPGEVDMVRLLLQHGANPDLRSVGGETALSIAKESRQTEVMRLLQVAVNRR